MIATDVLGNLDVAETARKNSADPHSVRQQFEKLQKALGIDLLSRVDGKLGLTEPGRKAMSLARDIIGLLDRIENLKTDMLTSREVIGLAPDFFAVLQIHFTGRKPPVQQRRIVLDTSANLKNRFEEKLLGLAVRYIHDYEAADVEHVTMPLVWAISQSSRLRPQKRQDVVQVDLPPKGHPIHRAAVSLLRKANVPFTIKREQPEGVYLPVHADAGTGPVHALVPEFQLERLKLVPTTHPQLQEPLLVHGGVFSHREFFAASDVDALGAVLLSAIRSLCPSYARHFPDASDDASRPLNNLPDGAVTR